MRQDDYHAVAAAFMAAGAEDKGDAEYDYDVKKLGWDNRDNELWAIIPIMPDGFTRQLTIQQILSATNAQPLKPAEDAVSVTQCRCVMTPITEEPTITPNRQTRSRPQDARRCAEAV